MALKPKRSPPPHRATRALLCLALFGCREVGASTHSRDKTASPAASISEPSSTTVPEAPQACAAACKSIERCEHGACVPACPSGQVYVPETPTSGFTMGAGLQTARFMKGMTLRLGVKAFDTPHTVVLTKPFCMDALEVTARAYEECETHGACTEAKVARWSSLHRFPEKPINDVSWKQARDYCHSVHAELPTEAQWEWAAKGSDERQWPWGNEQPTCERADFTPGILESPSANAGCNGGNASEGGTHPLGAHHYPTGDIHDLAGNVWEWTLDNAEPYRTDGVQTDPMVMTDEDRTHVVRGGGWNRSEVALRTTYRGSAIVGYQRPALGFRCVTNP